MEPAREYYIGCQHCDSSALSFSGRIQKKKPGFSLAKLAKMEPSAQVRAGSPKRFRAASPTILAHGHALQALQKARRPASFSGFSGGQPL